MSDCIEIRNLKKYFNLGIDIFTVWVYNSLTEQEDRKNESY